MKLRSKSPWPLLAVAAVAFLEAYRANLRDPHLNHYYMVWWTVGGGCALGMALFAWLVRRMER